MIKTPEFWQKRGFVSNLLLPFSLLWLLGSWFSSIFTKTYVSKCKIICVGNVLAGGVGKTPFAMSLMAGLQKLEPNLKFVFLSKGYAGTLKNATLLENHHSFHDAGEEALNLRKIAPVIIAKSRKEGVKLAEDLGFDVVIMDDGMQNSGIKKNVTILLIDSFLGFGNGRLIPAGPLRETLHSARKKADFEVIIKNDLLKASSDFDEIKWKAKIQFENEQYFHGKKIIAFAAIAYPEKFFASLSKISGMELFKKISFPDHHLYSSSEIQEILDHAEQNSAEIVTTEKDFVKIPEILKEKISVLKMSISIEEKLLMVLQKKLNML